MEARLTGTVLEVVKGKRYKLIANLRPQVDADGQRRYPRTTATVYASGRRDADAKLRDWLLELEQHDCTDPSRLTVGEVLRRWLERDAKPHTRPKTYERYAEHVDKLTLRLDDVIVVEFTPSTWSDFYVWAKTEGRKDECGGLSEQTCQHLFRALHRAFSWAFEERLMGENPLARIPKRSRPSPVRQRKATWDDGQILRAIDLAYADGNPVMVYVPAALAGWGGLRRSEICGLEWPDVLWELQSIVVERSIEQTKGGVLHECDPKSITSRRPILVPSDVIDVLREHRVRQDAMRLAHGPAWNARDRVVCRGDGAPMKPDAISNRWSEWAKRKKLEPYISFHYLRHSYATGLYHAGARTKTVQERLGHSTPAITEELYIHGTDAVDQALLEIQERRIAGARAARISHPIRTSVVSLAEARKRKACT